MDKSVNVSIAGISFQMETEAYRLLKDYLVRIEMGYRDNPDGAEIIADIEGRISELILNRQAAEIPVAPQLIKDIIAQLGYPDDMKETRYDNVQGEGPKIPRRLYRNPEGAIMGGVCSGLGTYFNIEPVIVRLIFVAPLILVIVFSFWKAAAAFFGIMIAVSFLLYFILWFAIPKAKTPRQRLEMHGEPITARKIEENFREDFEDVSTPEKSRRNASVLADLVYIVGKIALFFVKAIVLIIGFAIAISLIAIIVATVVGLSGGLVALGPGFWAAMGIQGVSPALAMILGVLLTIIPLVLLGYLLLKLVFSIPSGKTFMSILFGIWVIILVWVGVLTVRNVENVRDSIESGRIEHYLEDVNDRWEDRFENRWDRWEDEMEDQWEDTHKSYRLQRFDRRWERHVKRELSKKIRHEGTKEFAETKVINVNGKKYTYEMIYKNGEVTLKRNGKLYEIRDDKLRRVPVGVPVIYGDSTSFGEIEKIDTEKNGKLLSQISVAYNDTVNGEPKVRKVYLETRLINGKQVTDTVKIEYLDPKE